jgi:hypothetical protein
MFARTFEHVIRMNASKSKDKKKSPSIDDILGIQLSVSSRRDYRACVDFVFLHSEAESLNIQVGAVICSVNNESTKGYTLEQVEEAIHKALDKDSTEFIMIDFLQKVEEIDLDRNPFEMTKFPSPHGAQLPGVLNFFDYEHHEASTDEKSTPQQSQHRERSRSMKHFWMSDRSAKTCYECENLFNFFRRKHHCRSCGQIFCSKCCSRLPQSFGDTKEDESITRLRKQLVCHTCHRQLREGLEVELVSNSSYPNRVQRAENSPVSQTLLLIPPHIAEVLERSRSDLSRYKKLEKSEQFFDKDALNSDVRPAEQQEKSRIMALFGMFPKVQIVTSVQHLAHYHPRIQTFRQECQKSHQCRHPRTLSEPMILITNKILPNDERQCLSRRKRSNSETDLDNPSSDRWSEAELKRIVEQSKAEALLLGENPLRSRPKAMSANFGDQDNHVIRFGGMQCRNPFDLNSPDRRINLKPVDSDSFAQLPISEKSSIPLVASETNLGVFGLHDNPLNGEEDAIAVMKKEEVLCIMADHGQARIEERVFNVLERSELLSKLPIVEQHRWMQIINMFAQKAALHVSCTPEVGNSMDVMDYVRMKCFEGGRIHDSFFIDGVMVHKSLARKGMRSDIENPRILLIASELDYQRKKEAISSLESVAGQEIEYMHIVAEKIMTLHPDVVLFGGHVHRVAEEILFKNGVAIIKNVRMLDLQRIARSTGASLLSSYDHVDKISEKGIIGTCQRFYVMVSDQEPRSYRGIDMPSVTSFVSSTRKKRVQRQNIVFEGGLATKGCTICLRGSTMDVMNDISNALASIIRIAYNMRLQRAFLAEMGYIPPMQVNEQERSIAEEWFAKYSSSLYVSLKSNSLSLRAALKETQAMCKHCKENTRFNNISSLRVVGSVERRSTERQSYFDDSDFKKKNIQSRSKLCTCVNKASDGEQLTSRILFSACWSSLEGNLASQAEMMCIDFYSSNDCSIGQFFEKYCFGNNRDFRRAFATHKLSFSHDTGRVIICMKDISEGRGYSEAYKQQTPASDLLELAHKHASVVQLIRSNRVLTWSKNMNSKQLSAVYSFVSDDVWNYSFGKFLEDMFYGKLMSIDTDRFPHLAGLRRGSRDPSLVHFFSRVGRVVSVQCEPLEPVLHVALQPALWQDHIDHHRQLADIRDLCDLAEEVFFQTTKKISESMNDMVTPAHAKNQLKILRNEVQQWYSCYAFKVESKPPPNVFEKNAYFKSIYQHAADWSVRITQAMNATVKPIAKAAEGSPKSTLPKAWFEQFAGALNIDKSANDTDQEFQETVSDQAGNLQDLANFARSLATGEVSLPTGLGFKGLSNEVARTLNATNRPIIEETASESSEIDASIHQENIQNDPCSRSYHTGGQDSLDGSLSYMNNVGTASTIGSYSSRMALEAFRRAQQSTKQLSKIKWGCLSIPKRILAWHPSLPVGAHQTVVLVNESQPTSVVAYSLCSKEYTKQLNESLKRERVALSVPCNTVQGDYKTIPNDENMLNLLRSSRRSNIDLVFVDENQFQSATRFSCKSYYAMQFHALRRLYYGGDRNFVESLCHCEQWNAAGGKSGAGFLKTQVSLPHKSYLLLC